MYLNVKWRRGRRRGRGRKDPSITVSQLLLVPLFLWGHHHRNWNVHTATCDFVCGCTKVWITIEQSMRILWILWVFVAFVVCVCRPANDFFFPFCLLCVFVSLCCVCVCYQKMGSWSFARCQLSHTHTWIAGGYPHLGLPGCQLKPLHTHTHTAHLLPLSLSFADSCSLGLALLYILSYHRDSLSMFSANFSH